jgi:hypothetical protein
VGNWLPEEKENLCFVLLRNIAPAIGRTAILHMACHVVRLRSDSLWAALRSSGIADARGRAARGRGDPGATGCVRRQGC